VTKRTLADALRNAERLRNELPHLIQPSASDYDIVALAAELAAEQARHAETLQHNAEIGTQLTMALRLLRLSLDECDNETLDEIAAFLEAREGGKA
jgi:hypothetical protein